MSQVVDSHGGTSASSDSEWLQFGARLYTRELPMAGGGRQGLVKEGRDIEAVDAREERRETDRALLWCSNGLGSGT